VGGIKENGDMEPEDVNDVNKQILTHILSLFCLPSFPSFSFCCIWLNCIYLTLTTNECQ
jgi:hypothetical protein